jgi:hypothetical protein
MTVRDARTFVTTVARRGFWTRSRIAAGAIMLAGVAGAILVVAAGGFTSAAPRHLAPAVAAVLVSAVAFAGPGRSDFGGARAVRVLLWTVATLALSNVALAWINLGTWAWQPPNYVPSMNPIGADFRAAYAAAQQFSIGPTGWPPFTVVLAAPYLLFGPDAAYVVHVGILIALNVCALGLAAAVLHTKDGDDLPLAGPDGASVGLLAPVFAVWLFVSYGFLFSVERGNYDAFPAFLAMLGLWALVRRPAGIWLPTIAFSLAAEIKVYPALLLLLLIWRFRWKAILPIIACNVVLALSAGPGNLISFLLSLGQMIRGADWVGSSSAKSFSFWAGMPFHDNVTGSYSGAVLVALLLAIPAVVFIVTVWRLWRRHDHAATVLMLCATVPLMFVVPTISHDYKLVLLAGPALLLSGLLMRRIGRGSAEPWWMLITLCLVLFFAASPPAFVWPAILQNKYPWILLYQAVVAWMAWRLPAPVVTDAARADTEAADTSPPATG